MKNIESSLIVVQWDAVDDFLPTNYTVIWTSERDDTQVATLMEQTSYILTGLTLDTVYTITITAANNCGNGPEFTTSVSLPTGTYVSTTTNHTNIYTITYVRTYIYCKSKLCIVTIARVNPA